MELKKYKLGDIGEIRMCKRILKSQTSTSGDIPFYKIGTFGKEADTFINKDLFDTYKNLYNFPNKGDILISAAGTIGRCVVYNGEDSYYQDSNIVWIDNDESIILNDYLYYVLDNITWNPSKGSTILRLYNDDIRKKVFYAPDLMCQRVIADTLKTIDKKITLNRQINDNLEAMAKQLYDYWFVQFDFPNEEGKPYKSNGGAMVWNEELHMNIPYSWNTCLLNDYIGSNNTGDWGFDEPAEKRNMKVGCIRGADIVKLNDLPTRYIKDSNTSKLLSVWDIVIEVSGGSPTQATGRSAFVTPGVLKRNGGNLTCSNFCHAFTMKNYKASAYFFFMWRMFYDNNNMFNYEGKTSGIKNFMTDTFLANKWLDVPTALLDLFFERIKVIYEQIDNNIEEINALTKQRDELLPLLMNGQASVNYHLSASFLSSLILYAY